VSNGSVCPAGRSVGVDEGASEPWIQALRGWGRRLPNTDEGSRSRSREGVRALFRSASSVPRREKGLGSNTTTPRREDAQETRRCFTQRRRERRGEPFFIRRNGLRGGLKVGCHAQRSRVGLPSDGPPGLGPWPGKTRSCQGVSGSNPVLPREFSIPMPIAIPIPTRAARVCRAGSSSARDVSVRQLRRMGTAPFCDVLRFLRPSSCD
jgi:hypothetical protein